jgi:dTDP-4-dehydrorhamnose 3,5-epimerase
MKVVPSRVPDVLLLEPKVFRDERGFFFESFHRRAFAEATGMAREFVQENHSGSRRNVLRGLHYQIRQAQGKLVRVVAGEAWDVAVDLRRSSPTFGQWAGFHLSPENRRMAWIPEGFAHGFLALAEGTEILYLTTAHYAPEHERTIRWDDPKLAIDWPLSGPPILAPKDAAGVSFDRAELFD